MDGSAAGFHEPGELEDKHRPPVEDKCVTHTAPPCGCRGKVLTSTNDCNGNRHTS